MRTVTINEVSTLSFASKLAAFSHTNLDGEAAIVSKFKNDVLRLNRKNERSRARALLFNLKLRRL